MPKELLPLGDRPVLEHVLQELQDAGLERTILVTRPSKPLIEQYVEHVRLLSRFAMTIDLVSQGEIPGNGGAILSARHLTAGESFVVVWGDEIFLAPTRVSELLTAHGRSRRPTICLRRINAAMVRLCGIAETVAAGGSQHRVLRIHEKPDPSAVRSRLASVGGFVLTPDVVDTLTETPPGADGEVYLSAALDRYARTNELHGVEVGGEWFETGSYDGYARAFVTVATRQGLLPIDASSGVMA